jgi:hypothetical protein
MPARSVETSRSPAKRARRAAVRRRAHTGAGAQRRPRQRQRAPRPTLPPTVAGVVERLGRALGAGDLPGVAACFAYPSLYLTGADTHEFRDPLQVQTVFRQDAKAIADAGLGGPTLKVEHASSLGNGIYACDVRWRETGERTHLLVQESAVGTALIRAAVAVS